jgi:transcriptional regulator with XRE-family HTH domain
MRSDVDVWQALLRRKNLSLDELAERLGIPPGHAQRLLSGRRPPGSQRGELEAVLALGTSTTGRPLYAIAELDDSGELDLVPAGDAQPLFADREAARRIAQKLDVASHDVCVVPVWPSYAWRNLVGFHAAWGAEPEPRKLFVADAADDDDLLLEGVLDEIRAGLEATLRARAEAHNPAFLQQVDARLSG